jgi:DNA topoisomerase IB
VHAPAPRLAAALVLLFVLYLLEKHGLIGCSLKNFRAWAGNLLSVTISPTMGMPNDSPVLVILNTLKLLSDALLQLTARVDAVKAIVCELHPEVRERLEAKISKDQNANSKQFAEIQRVLENLSDQTH